MQRPSDIHRVSRWPSERGAHIDARPARARFAVNVLFFVNGALISTVIPRLPAIKASLGLSNSGLGVAVAAASFGALLAGPLAGAATTKLGSARVGVSTGVIYGGALSLIGLAGSWAALAAAFMLVGVLDVLMDVAMNAHGLQVQHGYQRSIFNGFHAWWSIGATCGSALGAAAAALDIPVPLHLLVVGGALAVGTLVVGPWLRTMPRLIPAGHERASPAAMRSHGLRVLSALAPYAALSVAAAIVEDVPGSFGAVYLHDWLGTSPGVAGLGFVGFVGGMTVGRLLADRLVDRFGAIVVVRLGNVLAATGLGGALLAGQPVAAVIGLTAVGLGASATIPSLFVFAGEATARPSDGIALVSWACRVGFLASPAIVGVVADAVSLPVGVALGVAAATTVAVAIGVVRRPQRP